MPATAGGHDAPVVRPPIASHLLLREASGHCRDAPTSQIQLSGEPIHRLYGKTLQQEAAKEQRASEVNGM